MFSTAHFISLIVTAILIAYFLSVLNKHSMRLTTLVLRSIAVILLFLNPLNWAYELVVYGSINYELNLPLHLCSIFWALFPFVAFLKKDSLFKRVSLASCATLGIVGGILGLLLNVHLNLNPFFSFPVIRSIVFHGIMLFAALLLWTSGIYKPQKFDQYLNFIPIIVLVFICIIVEMNFGYEYCYVRDGSGTPLTIVSDVLPRPIYLFVVYLALFLTFNDKKV